MARGSAPGERRGGRQKGTPNKNNREVKLMAQRHGPACIAGLADLMNHEEPDIRIRAMQALLDRGYGRPAQAVTGEGGEGPVRLEFSWATAAQSSGS